MKISISVKMLLLTLSSFILLIITVIASLYLYFNQFYEPRKIDTIINAMNDFTSDYKSNQWSDERLYTEVSKFMKKYNATMSIFSDEDFSITAVSTKANITAPSSYMLKLPDSLTFTANDKIPEFSVGTATSINGVQVLYPAVQITFKNTVQLKSEYQTHKKDGIEYIINTIPYTQYHQVSFNKKFSVKDGEDKITTVILSLQSVDEVMNFLKSIFPYLIVIAMALSAVMVAVYSKTITKPIVTITKISNRMANMELGIKSGLKRKDELGALSSSLNILSSNLKNTLDELSSAHEQLKDDYEQELRQEKARKEFVANVSHELKTPLGIIKSYSEGIRDCVRTEKRDHYLEVILEEISLMDQLLLEMLEISKFDAGAVVYHKAITDFNSLLNKAVHAFESKAAERDITITVSGTFSTVYIDYDKMERVMNNFIGNAVKYSHSYSEITILGECLEHKQKISITNECEPFPEEVLSKIWDRFYKRDVSHCRETEGTGLGLAITKSILKGHGCSYGVNNTENGVCFYFEMDYSDT